MEVDLTNYNAQRYPTTQSKLDAFAKRLDIISKFLKHEFVLRRKPVTRVLVSNFYEHFCNYCSKLSIKPKNKIDFNKALKDLGIEYKKSNGNNYYTVSLDELNALATKFKWIHALDEYQDEEEDKTLDFGVEQKDEEIKIDYEQLYKQQLDKLKALEKEMTELKSNSIILAKPPNVEPLLNSIKKFKNIVLPAKEDEYIDEEDIDDLLSMIRAN
jgi:hypothetical protein